MSQRRQGRNRTRSHSQTAGPEHSPGRRRIQDRIRDHLTELAEAPGLAFSQLLPQEMLTETLADCGVEFRNRIYTPVVTLWAFLWQVLSSSHTCEGAVARVVGWRIAEGLGLCSSNNGSYCEARQRLPLQWLKELLQRTGALLHAQVPEDWLWKGRQVTMVDGTTVSMPDTSPNQEAFPQPRTQKPGVGFPIARLVVVFSLACGAALDMALGPYKGKQTGENSLFRRLMKSLVPGDVVLADRCYSGYCDVALLQQHGADVVVRKHQLRKTDLSHGRRLGRDDHVVTWSKPSRCPEGLDQETFDQLPDTLELREVTVHVEQKGQRTRSLTLITTLLDPKAYTASDLAELYRRRWDAEIDLRSLKQTLQMDVLRCQTPEMVEKELWMHLLAYNAVRLLIGEAAVAHNIPPSRLSFSGCLQLLRVFHTQGLLAAAAADPDGPEYAAMLQAIAQRTIPHRPDRHEPRARKRRPKPYPLLQVPREEAREELMSCLS
jgi:hypothetical protein